MVAAMHEDEDAILVEALGQVGLAGGGRGGKAGARFTARRLKKNIYETTLSIRQPLGEAREKARRVLAGQGRLLEDSPSENGEQMIRAVVGAGGLNMKPTLITVVLCAEGPDSSQVRIRGAAKEGLIKQRAGEKGARRIAGLLTEGP
jgi:hypothetical protein